ncbi:DNA modification system-associated small protein [Hymenobacter sp. HD11105]
MNKGLDATFVHYGIRKDDLALINRLAQEAGLPEDWLDGVLKAYHEKKVRNEPLEDKDIQRLLNEQLDKIGQ